jgi:hypothetical protein
VFAPPFEFAAAVAADDDGFVCTGVGAGDDAVVFTSTAAHCVCLYWVGWAVSLYNSKNKVLGGKGFVGVTAACYDDDVLFASLRIELFVGMQDVLYFDIKHMQLIRIHERSSTLLIVRMPLM